MRVIETVGQYRRAQGIARQLYAAAAAIATMPGAHPAIRDAAARAMKKEADQVRQRCEVYGGQAPPEKKKAFRPTVASLREFTQEVEEK